ncbi:hypothetical protein AMK29_30750 [Streptomyces sp. CB02261]|nr:hypothetical protein AMK29_30750 [Streptomyces sp. CB02261]
MTGLDRTRVDCFPGRSCPVQAIGLGVTVMGQQVEDTSLLQSAVWVCLGCVAQFGKADHAPVAVVARLASSAWGFVQGLADVVELLGVFQPHHVVFVGEIACRQ